MEKISPKTMRGGLIFVLLLVIIFLLPNFIRLLNKDSEISIEQSNSYKRERLKLEREGKSNYSFNPKKKQYKIPPAKFNPNDYTLEDWMNLGLSEKQSLVVLKFTRYGIRSNDDLKKIFVIDEKLFALIKDSTFYPSVEKTTDFNVTDTKFEKQMEDFVLVNLNSATEEELDKVPGIGAYYAKSIIRNRDRLGGFYELKQLLELSKISEEQLAQWSPHFILEKSGIRKINVNSATVNELSAHPYITWNIANSLVKLREQHGPYKQIEDIKRSALIDSELYNKLKNYLKISE